MDPTDALRILELQPGHTEAELRAAYRDMLKVWHPDRFPQDSSLQVRALERTKRINEAFRILQGGTDHQTQGTKPPASSYAHRPAPPPPQEQPGDAARRTSPLKTYTAKLTGLRNPRIVNVLPSGIVLTWRGEAQRPETILWDQIERIRYSESRANYVLVSYTEYRYLYLRVTGRQELVLSDGLNGVISSGM